ncbi:CPBP family intramembrane glutamic endopeptidase [Salinibacterium sp. ZJ450]|uniref:CPBP family intramembrane glutamic endopeptidase n=1 Tax=Salinibacterium sp. ZJ450 TaxID=2708338 RepID=UPI00141EB06E|nr:type II CAAX endopeptidase family protein [Salinibacterium sp. ZJ450]
MTNLSSARPKTRRMHPIALFLLLSLGLAWLIASPLWLSGQGLATPGALPLLVVMMFVPAIAARVTEWLLPSGERFARLTTLRPRRPFRRMLPYIVIAWLGPILLTVAALGVAAALGVFQVDLVGFSGLAAYLDTLPGDQPIPAQTLAVVQMAALLVAPLINVIPALGEELGWRGWLQPRLADRFGQWGAALLTGVIWGLWHAPVILLGYNYPGYPAVAALVFMIVACILMSVLFGWVSDASGTVWMAALAHGFINGAGGLGALIVAAGHQIDPAATGVLGYTGWLVMAALIAILVVTRQFPVRARQSASHAALQAPLPAVASD